METIAVLVGKLGNKLPKSYQNRLTTLTSLNTKLKEAQYEHDEKPTDQTQEDLDSIKSYIHEFELDLQEDLTELVLEKESTSDTKNEKEDESSLSMTTLVVGALLFVGTLGAYNYFKNK